MQFSSCAIFCQFDPWPKTTPEINHIVLQVQYFKSRATYTYMPHVNIRFQRELRDACLIFRSHLKAPGVHPC